MDSLVCWFSENHPPVLEGAFAIDMSLQVTHVSGMSTRNPAEDHRLTIDDQRGVDKWSWFGGDGYREKTESKGR
jgi:hypothetical protein